MDSITMQILSKVMPDENAFAKALAHFMFREIVEDLHTAGKITDEEMKALNKEACNRAAFLTNFILPVKDMRAAFLIEAVNCTDWDDPIMTKDLEKRKMLYEEIGLDIHRMRTMGEE